MYQYLSTIQTVKTGAAVSNYSFFQKLLNFGRVCNSILTLLACTYLLLPLSVQRWRPTISARYDLKGSATKASLINSFIPDVPGCQTVITVVPSQRKERQKKLYKLRSLYSRRVWYIAFFANWCNSFRHKNNRYLIGVFITVKLTI
jgi:hypothetical protein